MRGVYVALWMSLMGGAMGLAQTATVVPTLTPLSGMIGSGGHFAAHGVKGLPYSLVATATSQQMLADGTTITNTHEEHIMRDSEGRERQEVSEMRDGKVELMSIFINDPVKHLTMSLMPRLKVAHVTHLPEPKALTPEQEARRAEMVAKAEAARKEHPVSRPDIEELGTQAIAGVVAEGKRRTTVIPVGRMGNDREMRVVMETWISPELDIVVRSTTDNPMGGKTTRTVTELQRGEPAAALFIVPTDYKVDERTFGIGAMAN